jgi:hypothetical protein
MAEVDYQKPVESAVELVNQMGPAFRSSGNQGERNQQRYALATILTGALYASAHPFIQPDEKVYHALGTRLQQKEFHQDPEKDILGWAATSRDAMLNLEQGFEIGRENGAGKNDREVATAVLKALATNRSNLVFGVTSSRDIDNGTPNGRDSFALPSELAPGISALACAMLKINQPEHQGEKCSQLLAR